MGQIRVTILEGARGTGKSTVARKIREKIPEVTLVNPTGFHLDGYEGFIKISAYYHAWISFFNKMNNSENHEYAFVFDRFFFSERVFSELYKDYQFDKEYRTLARLLKETADEVDVIFFTIEDEKELEKRLIRDKVPFGEAEENVAETIRQQDLYKQIIDDFESNHATGNVRLHRIDTSGKEPEEVEKQVFEIVGGP